MSKFFFLSTFTVTYYSNQIMHKAGNICNYYLLPLFKLNITSFGGADNFVNSYLDYQGKRLVVEIKNKRLSGVYWNHMNYELDYDKDGHTFIVFKFAEGFHETLRLFKEGKYSYFKPEHKALIKKHSGLNYKVPISKELVSTSDKLLALDREVDLKEKIERELGVRLSEDAELMSIPDENCFITLSL